MRCAQLVATVAVVVIVVGCAYMGGVSAPVSPGVPSPVPSVTTPESPGLAPLETPPNVSTGPSADPTPTTSATTPAVLHEPTLQPTPSFDSSPLPSPSFAAGLAASDRFWDRWVETECWFGIDPLPSSVAELVRDADLVVRGPIVDLYVGEYWRGDAYEPSHGLAYAKVATEEVFKGDPVSREAGFVEVQMGYAPNDLDELRAKLPAHDHLWFLGYEDPDSRGEFNQSEMVGFAYYAAQDVETVFREIGGVVEVLAPARIREVYGKDEFLLTLDGTDFEGFVQRVREESSQSGRAMSSFARISIEPRDALNRYAAC